MDKNQKKQVIIAMSGGVDSSVAAYLLKKQGYNVTGLYLRLFNDAEKEKQIKRITKTIGIPLIIKDVRREFKKKVIDYFLKEYKAGNTPNPCVMCNKEIKFRFLFDELKKLKADYVSTGHYARIITKTSPASGHPSLIKEGMGEVEYILIEAKDKTKDQSYFLYILDQKQLAKIIFPLGNYKKEEIKKIARKLKLPIKDGEESQNICFIADNNPDKFLRKNIKMKPGNIVDDSGKNIGKHAGLALYTIGQRRGINIGGKGPYFVIGKNLAKNRLIVSNAKTIPELYVSSGKIGQVSWVSKKPKMPVRVLSRIRYRNPRVNAIIKSTNNEQPTTNNKRYIIEFEKPQRAVTPGQSAVFYSKKGEVLGGGIISKK